jgi:glycosyltransferase involved in cell wall biosynthesis
MAIVKVLNIYYSNAAFGGVERFLVTLIRCRKLAPSLEFAFGLFPEGPFSERLSALGASLLPLDLGAVRLRNPLSVRRARQTVSRLLETQAIDLVILHNFQPWLWAIIAPSVRSAGVPLLLWIHSVEDWSSWLGRWAMRTRPDHVICNSHFTRTRIKSSFSDISADVCYYPVEAPGTESSDGTESLRLRGQGGVTPDTTVIIQASRLDRWKGHQLLLEALGKLRDLPGWTCWQVGGPQFPHEIEYLEHLKQRALELGIAERIRFIGYRDDVYPLLRAADIHCQPNTSPEPFGIAFVEALYAGLPVVTTAMGGALEIVDESCGILVPPGDVSALAGALAGLIGNRGLRASLGARGPAHARQTCDSATQMAQLEAVLIRAGLRSFTIAATQETARRGNCPGLTLGNRASLRHQGDR